MMTFKEYLIEIGGQVCINPDGTTGLGESNVHLRKFSKSEIESRVGRSLQQLDRISKKFPNAKKDDKIDLLSIQVQELSKILSVFVSMELRGAR